MTTYRVVISPGAQEALDAHIKHIAIDKMEPLNAQRWLQKAYAAVDTLSMFPNRCPIAPESKFSKHTIRMLNIDKCSFLYRVDDDQDTVYVTGFLHGGVARPQ